LTFLNILGEYFISHEKSGHVIKKDDVWYAYLAMLLICDLCKSEKDRRKIYQKRVET